MEINTEASARNPVSQMGGRIRRQLTRQMSRMGGIVAPAPKEPASSSSGVAMMAVAPSSPAAAPEAAVPEPAVVVAAACSPAAVPEPQELAWASSRVASPAAVTLVRAAEILKDQLGLEGNVGDVVKQAAFQLDVPADQPLAEMAKQCLQKLG